MQNQIQVLIDGQQQMQQQMQQMQEQMNQMQEQKQRVEEGLAVLNWTFRNDRIRAANYRRPNKMQPLHVEQTGGNAPVGSLPPATVPFPNNRGDAIQLTAIQLNQLEVFYHVQFAGPSVSTRRVAFLDYVMGPQ